MSLVAIPPAHITPRFTPRQRLVLLVLLGAGFTLSVDFSILTVALPRIGDGVGLAARDLPWITTAFVLPAAGLTLVCGRLADVLGRRRMLRAGMVLLALASLLGGIATAPGPLLAARALQGLASAITLPAAMSMLTTVFAEGPARSRALALNGALLSGGFTVGSLVGGTLVSALGWRAAFVVNLPVALAIAAAAPRVLAESSVPRRPQLDLPGAVTVTAGLLAVVAAVIDTSPRLALAGGVLLAVFWLLEHRASAPLVPPRVLARRTVAAGNLAALTAFAMESAMIFLVTLHLQRTLDLPPLVTGVILGVPGLASVGAGILAGRLIGRFGSRAVLTVGLAVQGLATAPLLFLGDGPDALLILVPALFVGFCGHVPAIVAATVTATSGVPDDEQGLATGLVSMTQQVAVTVGIPVLSAIAATQVSQVGGFRLALGVDVIATLACVAVVTVLLRHRPRTARNEEGNRHDR